MNNLLLHSINGIFLYNATTGRYMAVDAVLKSNDPTKPQLLIMYLDWYDGDASMCAVVDAELVEDGDGWHYTSPVTGGVIGVEGINKEISAEALSESRANVKKRFKDTLAGVRYVAHLRAFSAYWGAQFNVNEYANAVESAVRESALANRPRDVRMIDVYSAVDNVYLGRLAFDAVSTALAGQIDAVQPIADIVDELRVQGLDIDAISNSLRSRTLYGIIIGVPEALTTEQALNDIVRPAKSLNQ